MALIVKQLQNKRPVSQVKNSTDIYKKSVEHMPRWTKWQNETIERLKAEKTGGKREKHA